jgi:hypothetical protein
VVVLVSHLLSGCGEAVVLDDSLPPVPAQVGEVVVFGHDFSLVLELGVEGGSAEPEEGVVAGGEVRDHVRAQLPLPPPQTAQHFRVPGLQFAVEVSDDLHLLAQGLALLARLEHLHLRLLHVVLQHDVLELPEGVARDQAGDVVESHPHYPVAQQVEKPVLGVLLEMDNPGPGVRFGGVVCGVGGDLFAGEDGGSGDGAGDGSGGALALPGLGVVPQGLDPFRRQQALVLGLVPVSAGGVQAVELVVLRGLALGSSAVVAFYLLEEGLAGRAGQRGERQRPGDVAEPQEVVRQQFVDGRPLRGV